MSQLQIHEAPALLLSMYCPVRVIHSVHRPLIILCNVSIEKWHAPDRQCGEICITFISSPEIQRLKMETTAGTGAREREKYRAKEISEKCDDYELKGRKRTGARV